MSGESAQVLLCLIITKKCRSQTCARTLSRGRKLFLSSVVWIQNRKSSHRAHRRVVPLDGCWRGVRVRCYARCCWVPRVVVCSQYPPARQSEITKGIQRSIRCLLSVPCCPLIYGPNTIPLVHQGQPDHFRPQGRPLSDVNTRGGGGNCVNSTVSPGATFSVPPGGSAALPQAGTLVTTNHNKSNDKSNSSSNNNAPGPSVPSSRSPRTLHLNNGGTPAGAGAAASAATSTPTGAPTAPIASFRINRSNTAGSGGGKTDGEVAKPASGPTASRGNCRASPAAVVARPVTAGGAWYYVWKGDGLSMVSRVRHDTVTER